MEEEVHLAKSWVNISQDPIIGNEQKDQAFWKRIGEYYNKYRPNGSVERHYSKLKSHFYMIHPLLTEFSGIYNNFYNNRGSGWSDEDVLVKAHSLWKSNKNNKSFNYEHMWRVLKECEKYAPQEASQSANKKARTSESGGYTSTSNLDMNINIDDCEVHTRPIGQKAAKRKMKSKKKEVDEVEVNFLNGLEKMEELQREKIEIQKAEIAQRERELVRWDYETLMKDTSAMTEEQLRMHLVVCEQIKKRHGLE